MAFLPDTTSLGFALLFIGLILRQVLPPGSWAHTPMSSRMSHLSRFTNQSLQPEGCADWPGMGQVPSRARLILGFPEKNGDTGIRRKVSIKTKMSTQVW